MYVTLAGGNVGGGNGFLVVDGGNGIFGTGYLYGPSAKIFTVKYKLEK